MKPGTRRLLISLIVVMALLFSLNALHTHIAMESLAFWGYPYVRPLGDDLDIGVEMEKFQCPRFIARGESKRVGVSLTNTTDHELNPNVQTILSYPNSRYGILYADEMVTLQAGETKPMTWEVNDRYIVNGLYVMVRFFVSREALYSPARSVHCHLLVMNLFGLPSETVGFGLFVVLGLATLVLAALFILNDPFTKYYRQPRTSLVFMLVALAIMTFGSLIGSWLIGLLMIILIVLGLFIFLQVGYM